MEWGGDTLHSKPPLSERNGMHYGEKGEEEYKYILCSIASCSVEHEYNWYRSHPSFTSTCWNDCRLGANGEEEERGKRGKRVERTRLVGGGGGGAVAAAAAAVAVSAVVAVGATVLRILAYQAPSIGPIRNVQDRRPGELR